LLLGSVSGWTFEGLRDLEFRYPPLQDSKIPSGDVVIVVLGSGFNPDPELPANSQVGGAFLSRLLEGVRLWRLRPDAELVISVAGTATGAQKSNFLSGISGLLGLQSADVRLLTTAESTLDEALLVRDLAVGRTVLLATSAGHMPRAMQIFESEGLTVVAAPTDYGFVRRGSPRDRWWPRWIPSAEGIGANHGWLYEQVAGLWQTIRQLSGTHP
jgi:uncharacterized SAM-binding protein YcdF (DUF218 family)